MDATTYSDPEVVDKVNSQFVPIRVDIDKRPDISDRYNRGGFPTTAFLSDRGESIWGATYVPPSDMKRILDSILDAQKSGEIDAALERSRMPYLDLSKGADKSSRVEDSTVLSLFEDIFAAYDVEHGGFGTEPKFPQPDALDLLMVRLLAQHDENLVEAVRHTIETMRDGLYDEVEGGLFRYSVTQDWKAPHYEKMLETNAGFLRNLTHAYYVLDEPEYLGLARGVVSYILRVLRDPDTGAFFGSQDADEEYYRSPSVKRSRMRKPSVDRTIYCGWNADAAAALIESGAALKDRTVQEAGGRALGYNTAKLWNEKLGLFKHTEGQELYLLDDQISTLDALIAWFEITSDKQLLDTSLKLVEGIDQRFPHEEGGFGDIIAAENELGELQTARRSLISNSKYATLLGKLGLMSGRVELVNKSMDILDSFTTSEVQAYGVFASAYVMARWALRVGPRKVEVHASPESSPTDDPLWTAAKRVFEPGLAAVFTTDLRRTESSFAVVCTLSGCSDRIVDPKALADKLSVPLKSQ